MLSECLVCAYGGKLDRTKLPCSKKDGLMINPYVVKDCPDHVQDTDKTKYLLMSQICNIAGLHEMSTPIEITIKKIEERIQALRDLEPDI